VELADLGDGHPRRTHALPKLGLVSRRLDVDDDVARGERALHGGLHAVGGGMPLADRRTG
jgi:hypothetical protein